MAIQTLGVYPFLPSILGRNPVQTIGLLSVTLLAMNTLSSMPTVQATDASTLACQIACDPLPGEKDDPPERICVKTCEEGAEIIKTKTKEVMKDGKWTTVQVLGKVATPIAGYFDCMSICANPLGGGGRVAANLFTAGVRLFWSKDATGAASDVTSAVAKGGCIALLFTPAGYPGCMACCAGTKLIGAN